MNMKFYIKRPARKNAALLNALILPILLWSPSSLAAKYNDLCRAAEAGDLAAMKEFLADKTNPNAECAGGSLPLIMAAQAGQPEAVKFLLKNGAEVGRKGIDFNSPMRAVLFNLSKDD